MALQMIVTIVGATFLGRYIDEKAQSKFPTGTLVGIFAGMGIALYRVFTGLKRRK
jgi:F0F1-type ATP synthase assembly protein I